MLKSHIAPVERPRCPTYKKTMVLVRSAPSGSRHEVRTFECAKCGRDKIVEATDPLYVLSNAPQKSL
jgi:hypothetical protein